MEVKELLAGILTGTFTLRQRSREQNLPKWFSLAAEAAKIKFANSGKFDFSDVPENSDVWYMPYVKTLAKAEVINGYPDGTFRPGDFIIMAEMLKMMILPFFFGGNNNRQV